MGNFKGTQGKWNSKDVHDDTRTYDIRTVDDRTLATVWTYNLGKQLIDLNEQAANAKLIAAAPELLAELEYALEAVKAINSFGATTAIIDRIEATIKKATE